MKISKIRDVKTPVRSTSGSAGIDFFIPNDFQCKNINNKLFLYPRESIVIPSGIYANVPENYALIAFNKSGIAINKNLQIGACVIDSDYQGEIHIHLTNIGDKAIVLMPGEKIAQFLLTPIFHDIVEEVYLHELYDIESERGTGRFGSTNE